MVADSSHQFCAQAVKNVRTRRSEACGVATERWSEPSIAVGCRTVPIHRSSECTAPSHSTRVCKWSRVRLFESDVGLTSAGPAVQPNPTNSYSVVRYTHVPLFPWTNSRCMRTAAVARTHRCSTRSLKCSFLHGSTSALVEHKGLGVLSALFRACFELRAALCAAHRCPQSSRRYPTAQSPQTACRSAASASVHAFATACAHELTLLSPSSALWLSAQCTCEADGSAPIGLANESYHSVRHCACARESAAGTVDSPTYVTAEVVRAHCGCAEPRTQRALKAADGTMNPTLSK